ncbi:MAG: hypothetical protein HC769_07810 [Cyanobacteria bacterium CRU_2_1]|nr:hypothetical protein [Cyanobacteria bacterium RU_5_0]NJR58755.1 hypothetical protein [Cyanobacteria bacterium CRU_2_1]
MRVVLFTLTTLALTTGVTAFALPGLTTEGTDRGFLIAQSRQAEDACIDAVEEEGYEVDDILSSNSFSGGEEVILEVSDRSDVLVVGCDYADSTGDVELYVIEDEQYLNEDDDDDDEYGYDDSDEDWRNQFYDSDGVSDRGYAEDIARELVGDQLGINDPYSDVVEIDNVSRESGGDDRAWLVEGSANGAPFQVLIRADDAYILDFVVY